LVDAGFLGAIERVRNGRVTVAADHRVAGVSLAG